MCRCTFRRRTANRRCFSMGHRPKPRRQCAAPAFADEQSLRGIYGALPQTPSAFLEKAEEKQYFTAKHPTHSVRALLCGSFLFDFNKDCAPKLIIAKTQKFYKIPPVLASSR